MQRLVLIVLLISGYCLGQGWAPAGSRSRAMGDASVTLQDVWAYHHNPAAIVGIKKVAFGISYENRFLLKTLHEFEDYYFVSKIELKSASSKAKKDCTYIFRQLQSKTYE